MSNINLIIEERAADIGKFLVGRLLPFRQKRMVGPFIYIDHMGPAKLDERTSFDVLPHPHIGLSTLTFLFDGSIMHRDSLGNAVEIQPGEVNWMTAGKGIVHSERTPEYLRHSEKSLHGLQIWVALPKQLEEMEPEFFHISESEIPKWEQNGASFKLIAGEAFNRKSGVPVYSRLYMIEIRSKTKQHLALGEHLYGESGLYVLEGGVESNGNVYEPKQMLVTKESHLCEFTLLANSIVYIFGGEPFPEERFIDWNFVSSSKERIEEAKERWKAQRFEKVKGDEKEYVPYPTLKK
ncbi:MAG: pirin family protein [Bacteroidia bacterium]|jgi:redox-sensitive bicupin YhaK (pirin superfamily)|nr:pirin family protein [Bacteroidia bacterium]